MPRTRPARTGDMARGLRLSADARRLAAAIRDALGGVPGGRPGPTAAAMLPGDPQHIREVLAEVAAVLDRLTRYPTATALDGAVAALGQLAHSGAEGRPTR